jgi:hypothetical protein
MYLASPDYLHTVTRKNTPPPPPQSPKTEKAGKKHNSSKRLRSAKRIKTKKKKKYFSQREHDMWVENASQRDVDVTMVSGLKYVANFTRRYRKKEPDKDCSRFLKASTPSLPLLGYAERT